VPKFSDPPRAKTRSLCYVNPGHADGRRFIAENYPFKIPAAPTLQKFITGYDFPVNFTKHKKDFKEVAKQILTSTDNDVGIL
jgi:hypothetical protein